MAHAAKILAHSISPNMDELITYETIVPRIVLSEFNTHREFSRNSASSRAIPVKKMIKMVMENPYIPTSWGKNQKGMQAGEDVSPEEAQVAEDQWLEARDSAVGHARYLLGVGIHKGLTNRLLEPFMWHTIIVTSSLPGMMNFFHLRDHPMAHPDIQIPAAIMHKLWKESTPQALSYGQWHLPLIQPDEHDAIGEALTTDDPWEVFRPWVKISSGRCARVTHLTHEGIRDINKDVDLHDGLLGNGHMSPLEHPARPMTLVELETYRMYHYTLEDGTVQDSRKKLYGYVGEKKVNERITHRCGNFDGWIQHRKEIPNEHDKMADVTG